MSDAGHPAEPAPATAVEARPEPGDAQRAVIAAAIRLPEPDRRALAGWLETLLKLRRDDSPALRKAIAAVRVDDAARALAPLLRTTGRLLYDLAWRDRTEMERLGVGVAALASTAFVGPAAGAAAVGGAVGVPLWIVLGPGGPFAEALLAELRRSLPAEGAPRAPEDRVVDADYRIVPGSDDMPPFELLDGGGEEEPEPLWRVFRRAFRDARARQRTGDGG
jgi:hypothetical protein